jgi:transglutaminase-like putative cysteine protease
LYSGLARQSRPRESTFGQTLSLGGERTVDDSLVFTVQTSSSARYWRAVAFDTFNGRQWVNSLDSETDFNADTLLPTPNWLLRQPISQTINLLAPTGNVIFAPPDLRQVSVPVEVLGQLAPIEALGAIVQDPNQGPPPGMDITFARARSELASGDSYSLVSQYADVTRRALEGASTNYSDAILEKYLQLPENFSQRVAQTAITVTAELETPYTKAKAIETYLRTIPYNDAIPAPPPEIDPIEYFLYDIGEGYCDYYATAMVLMLRSLGVPSRAVSGYAEGAYDEESGLYFVTDRDAHTWVEVFFPDLGWIEFEPTSGESPLERPEGADGSALNQPQGVPTDTSGLSNPSIDPFMENMQDPIMDDMVSGMGQTSDMTRRWWLWALLTPLLLILGILGLRRTQVFGPIAFTPELPPILFERLQQWAGRLGLRPRASETPYEQAYFFGRALPEGQPFINEITEGYVRYRFGQPEADNGDAPLSTKLASPPLVSAWQQLHPVLWRAWGRKALGIVLRRRNGNFSSVREPGV